MSSAADHQKENASLDLGLAGKVAIVTGSSRGIGAAIAKRLASAGATVAVNYVRGAEAAEAVVAEIEQAGGTAHAFQADVSVRAQVFDLVDRVHKRWGRVDVFVNNSAIAPSKSLGETTEDEVDRIFAINLKGTLWGIQAASGVLTSGGSIINISSILGRRYIWPNVGIYSASKAASDMLTRTAAAELGPRGIRVNAIAPGVIETDINAELSQEFKAEVKAQTPLEHRLGSTDEIAKTAVFLASAQASWVTSQIIELAGGMT